MMMIDDDDDKLCADMIPGSILTIARKTYGIMHCMQARQGIRELFRQFNLLLNVCLPPQLSVLILKDMLIRLVGQIL